MCSSGCGRSCTASPCWSCRRAPTSLTMSASWRPAGSCSAREVLTFNRLVREIGRVAGVGARPLGPGRARSRGAGRDRRRPAARAGAVGGGAGLRGGGGRAVRRAAAVAGRARALHARAAGVGGRRRATRTSSRRSTRSTARGSRRSGARIARARRGRRSTRCARSRERGARRPVFFYGFDELTRAQLDAVETLARVCEADVWVTLPYEPGRHALAGSAATVHELRAAGSPRSSRCRSRRADARRALRRGGAAGAAPPRALAVRGRRRAAPAQRRRAAARGRRRARGGRARRRRGAGADARRDRGRGHRGARARVGRRRRCSRRCSATTGSRWRASRRVPLARTRLGAGVLAWRARPRWRAGAPRTCCAWLRTPGMTEARRRRPSTRSRRACAGREETGARAAARKWAPWALPRLDALAAAAEAGAGRSRSCWPRWRRGRGDLGGAPRAPRRRARPRGARRRARRRRAALAPRPSCARCRSGAARATPSELLETLGAVEVRQGDDGDGVLLADPLGDPRAPLPRRVRVRAAGRRVPAVGRRPSRSSTTSARRALASPSGLRAAAPRGRARPRALAVLRLRLAPAGGAVPLLALVRRGGRAAASRRRSSTTCARCSPTSCGSSAAGGCWPR